MGVRRGKGEGGNGSSTEVGWGEGGEGGKSD